MPVVLQLLHEVEVGVDDLASRANVLIGGVERQVTGAHQVGQAHGGRPTPPGMAMHQHFPAVLFYGICTKHTRTFRPFIRFEKKTTLAIR